MTAIAQNTAPPVIYPGLRAALIRSFVPIAMAAAFTPTVRAWLAESRIGRALRERGLILRCGCSADECCGSEQQVGAFNGYLMEWSASMICVYGMCVCPALP